jgi:hypothetical protein
MHSMNEKGAKTAEQQSELATAYSKHAVRDDDKEDGR